MKKNLLFTLLAAFTISNVEAQTQSQEVVFRFVAGKDMLFTPWGGNGESLQRLSDFISANRESITSGKAPIYVNGYCEDMARAKVMSNRVKSEMIVRDGMREDNFRTHNSTESYKGKKNLVVVRIAIPAQDVSRKEGQPEVEPQSQPAESFADVPLEPQPEQSSEQPQPEQSVQSEPIVEEPQIVEQSQPTSAPEPVAPREKDCFSLRTNLLYWVGGLPNFGFEWNVSHTVGIVVNGGYAPWASNSWTKNWGGWFVSPEVRFYLGEPKRWFVGAEFLAGGFNMKPSDTGCQGTMMAGGIVAGYKLPLGRSWSMDFTLGGGYGQLAYDSYNRTNGYNIYKERDVKKNTFMPIQAGVSLIWKIN